MDAVPSIDDAGRVELLHASPGRIRLRLPEIKGNPARARELEQQVAGLGPLRRVDANPVTGSLLIVYDADDAASLVEIARQMLPELSRESLSSPPDEELDVEEVTPSAVQAILARLQAANAQVRTATGGLDLRILVPALLVTLGIRNLVMDEKRRPAWYNYFWFAFGTFCTLNRRTTAECSSPGIAGPAAAENHNGNGNGEPDLDPAEAMPLHNLA